MDSGLVFNDGLGFTVENFRGRSRWSRVRQGSRHSVPTQKPMLVCGVFFSHHAIACFFGFRFGRSTALYASWMILLIVVGEYTTGKITDALWTANNYGKTFDTVDWSKFDQFEDDEEEEDDDDDDDDDDDE